MNQLKNLSVAIFILLSSFHLYAQIQSDTPPIWRQALGGAVIGLPTVQAQSAVVVCDGGNVRAYSTQGKPLWNYYAHGRVSPFITRSPEGSCYLSRTNGTFIAINRSGRELWRINPGDSLSGPVVTGWDGRLFIPIGKKILCYTGSGNRLWQKDLENPIALGPKIDRNGGILMVLDTGEILQIDPFGKTFSRMLSGLPAEILSVGTSEGKNRIMVFYKNGAAEIIDPESINPLPYTLPRLPHPPVAGVSRENSAAVVLDNGQVMRISGDDGSFLWTGDSHLRTAGIPPSENPGLPQVSMLYDDRGIYVLSKSGATGFTGDGRRLWIMHLDGAAAIPAFGDDGLLYSGGTDWILYAYRLEDRIRAQKQSLYGNVPDGTYGTGSPPPSPWADYYFRFDESEIERELGIIENAVKQGQIGEEELAYAAYLMETSQGEPGRPFASVTHPPVQVHIRVRALKLLGSIGSRETIPFLTGVFSREGDSLIKAAAAEAIGKIGIDPDGLALQAFLNYISPTAYGRSEQSLAAVAAATGALCRFSGPPLADMGIKILTLLTLDGQPKLVQQQARKELLTLKM